MKDTELLFVKMTLILATYTNTRNNFKGTDSGMWASLQILWYHENNEKLLEYDSL